MQEETQEQVNREETTVNTVSTLTLNAHKIIESHIILNSETFLSKQTTLISGYEDKIKQKQSHLHSLTQEIKSFTEKISTLKKELQSLLN